MTATPQFDVDRKKATIITWALIIACCAIAAPAALFILKGLFALAIAGAVAVGGIFFAPIIGHKLAIQQIKAVVSDAEQNPIENLQSEFLQMQQDVKRFESEVRSFAADVSSFAQQTSEFKRDYPDDAKMFEDQLTAYRELQTFKEAKFKQAVKDLDTFSGVVRRAKAMWTMALSSKRMNELAGHQTGDVFSQIRKETSLDAVRKATYESFAEVRTALLQKVDTTPPAQQAMLADPNNVTDPIIKIGAVNQSVNV